MADQELLRNPIESKEAQELLRESENVGTTWVLSAIKTDEQYIKYGEGLKQIKDAKKKLEDKRKSFTAPIMSLKKQWDDFFRSPIDKLDKLENDIKKELLAFQKIKDEEREEAERKAKEASDKEKDKLLKKAEKAEANGNTEKAQELRQTAESQQMSAHAPVIAAPKIPGIAKKTNWKFRIVDEKLVPREFLKVDEVKLGRYATAMKKDAIVPGIEFYPDENLAAGSK